MQGFPNDGVIKLLKNSIYQALVFYSGIVIISAFFLVTYLIAYIDTGDLFALFLIFFNSFVVAFCARKLPKWYRLWVQYKKHGVKGTWE